MGGDSRRARENVPVAFEEKHYGRGYFEGLHPHRWFRNPPRKYAERNRDALRVVAPRPSDRILELGSARGDFTFGLAEKAREVVGLDASEIALELAEAERARRGLTNVRFVKGDVADLTAFRDASFDAIAAIDLVEHVDDPTLGAMLRECRRVLPPGGRLGVYTPDRAHYVERLKARALVLKQFPEHIAVRRVGAYERFLAEAGFAIDLLDYSVSPFPFVRWIERVLAPLPLVGPTFRYRILIRAVASPA
jgi:2-polyprenyl-6-hydroxyphenyl methylase / 3-demethylubiquinone-9 3-methyltransferase